MEVEIEKALSRSPIACGTQAEVYALDDHSVVKRVYLETDGFNVVTQMSHAFIERFKMPRIDFSRSYPDEGIFVIEKLYRTPYDLWVGTDNIHAILNDLHRRTYARTLDFSEWISPEHPLYDITVTCFKAWKFVRRLGYPVSMDLNPGNIMMRKNGAFVLSDPFGHLDI